MTQDPYFLNTVTEPETFSNHLGNSAPDGVWAEANNEPTRTVRHERTPNPLSCSLEQVLDEKNLELARIYVKKKTRRFANIKRREKALEECDYWTPERIIQIIRSGEYRPHPFIMCKIPKDNGGERTLLIQTPLDRIISQAVRQIIEPICEEHIFGDHSYAYRPKRSSNLVLRYIESCRLAGFNYVVKADLSHFFDTIPHGELMKQLQRLHPTPELALLLKQIIKDASYRDPVNGKVHPIHQGVPQGGILSPLFANLYGERLDRPICLLNNNFSRYADDIAILCHNKQEADEMLATLQKEAEGAHLTLNMDKTKCVPIDEFEIFNVSFSQQGMFLNQKSVYRWLEKQTTNSKGKQKTLQDKVQSFSGWLTHCRSIDPRILLHPETIANIQSMLESLEDRELARQLNDIHQEFLQQLRCANSPTSSASVCTQTNNAAVKDVLSDNGSRLNTTPTSNLTAHSYTAPAVEPSRFERLGSTLTHEFQPYTESVPAKQMTTSSGPRNLDSAWRVFRTMIQRAVQQQADLYVNLSLEITSRILFRGQAYAYNTGTCLQTESQGRNTTPNDLFEQDLGIIQPEFGF